MNWNEQVKLLNETINRITIEIENFEKHTNIFDLVEKFNKIGPDQHVKFIKIAFDNDKYTNDYYQANKNINSQNIQTIDKFLSGGKKIKRKHLMKKIHPDKLDFTIKKIKNIIKHKDLILFESCDFDEEKKKISQCVIKILSENLNIIDCLKLLRSNTKLFKYICNEIEMTQEQIDKFEENNNNYKIFSNTNTFSNTIFSNEVINFVNNYNLMTQIESLNKQVLSNLKIIYDSIKHYIENNIYENIIKKKKIIKDLEKEKRDLLFDLDYKKNMIKNPSSLSDLHYTIRNSSSLSDYYINNLKNDILKISEKINVIEEQIHMFTEENRIFLVQDEILSQFSIKNFIEVYKNIDDKSNIVYEYFMELKKKLPIFYEFISGIVGRYSSYSTGLVYSYQLTNEFELITEQEIARLNFSI
jgi:galactitol-specific phosphotransferase system IIB component